MGEELAEGIFAAWAVRAEAGEATEFEELVREHPVHADALRRFHDDWKHFAPLLGKVVPGLIASDEGIVVTPLSGSDEDAAAMPSTELLERLGIHAPNTGRYRFRAVLGRGGGGVVLKVWDTKLNRPLAMKLVLGRGEDRPTGMTPKVDSRTLTRFVDEARIASQLNHPGIVPVHELGADESGRAFFTMKLVKGEDLSAIFEHVKTGKDGWNQTRALNVLLRVCEAMAFAHDKGVIHRDLKPANIMVGRYGEVHVMDWGLARVAGEKDKRDIRIKPQASASVVDSVRAADRDVGDESPLFTIDGVPIGTPAYMSPEQARGDIESVGVRSDVYSIGAMLYELIAGQPPYLAPGTRVGPYTIVRWVIEGPPKPLIDLAPRAPAELIAIADKAMERDASLRYASTQDLGSDLRAFLEGRVVKAYETGTWAETRKWVRRNRGIAGSLAAALVIALGWVVTFAHKSQEATQRADELAIEKLRAEEKSRLAQIATERAEREGYVAAIIGADAARRANEPASVRRLLDSAPKRLRNWEWGYLNAASDTSLFVIECGEAKFSPDGTRLVTTSDATTATVWDAWNGTELLVLDAGTNRVDHAAYGPDGKRIVTSYGEASACVWDALSGREIVRLDGHTSWVTSACFSADGTRILTVSLDKTMRVWGAARGEQIARVEVQAEDARSAEFSPDGARIISVWSDHVARVVESTTGRELFTLKPHKRTVGIGGAQFSSDGTRILASSEGTGIWDAKTGDELRWLPDDTGWVEPARFSSDGTRVVTKSNDSTARVWDAKSGAQIAALRGHTSWIGDVNFSADGAKVVTASGDNTARIWDSRTGRELAKLEGHMQSVRSAEFSRDGTRVLTTSDDGTARLWDWAASTAVRFERCGVHAGEIGSAVFTSDSTRIVTAAGHHGTDLGERTARVRDAGSGRQLARLVGHEGVVKIARGSPDGSRIVTASDDKTARVWDAMTGKELANFAEHTGAVNDATFSSDGARIVTASEDRTVRVWDSESGQEVAQLEGAASPFNSASFSPDGARIVATSSDRSLWVWDLATARALLQSSECSAGVGGVSFSPDGTRIIAVTLDDTVKILDASTGKPVVALAGQTTGCVAASFSADGSRVVTASMDGTVRIWDALDGRALLTLDDNGGSVTSASFSPDGARIVATSYGAQVRIWDSVPVRMRVAERQALERAQPRADRAVHDAISATDDWIAAAGRVRDDASLDAHVRRAALDALTVRANASLLAVAPKRAERTWILRMLGRESWPPESPELKRELALDAGAGAFASEALRIVDLYEPEQGDEVRALALARLGCEPDAGSFHREILALALFRVGRFDEALAEQRRAIAEASDDEKSTLENGLGRLEAAVAAWRDESGKLRVAEWNAKIEALDREIAALENEPDVRRWLSHPR